MITQAMLIEILENICKTIEENMSYLTELDIAIGDGDHGINMNKGFTAVLNKLPSLQDKDCGVILKTTAMTLISTVGGASGPLYGTAFLKASSVVNGKMEINNTDLLEMFNSAIQGIVSRGHANKGDKTMLDALYPAYDALKEAIDNNNTLKEALQAATEAALGGVEYTKTIKAIRGRASYLGERSIGHQDPGATSSYLMLNAAYNTINKRG
ncbi:dihydroxyacetone kinase subunit DhaL [Alkaliphilus peptidifermentans]|uniref:phosphoenolpyruvate--glycerone phosphotransferase n=1 Tax=Alkaliphilus peptidifermentans DSM 18978 TaxID=1120976 RepID=A0A1G5FVR9_9FIRM|nr:dihydroxyacetone kinase subunit DhaL [Alkaliphilus peptidifermentans]SCY43237.1 dihydroxyacetone kinase DhaL subunit [Alkaliphilus peptidifermentans DSM 18978]